MSDLTGFLLARVSEDETVMLEPAHGYDAFPDLRGRVLAECAAKRRVVNDYAELWQEAKRLHYAGEPEDLITTARNMYAGLHLALRNLAAVYADHPDYRDEWRP